MQYEQYNEHVFACYTQVPIARHSVAFRRDALEGAEVAYKS